MDQKYMQWRNYPTACCRFWLEKEWESKWQWRVQNLTAQELEFMLRDVIREEAFKSIGEVNLFSVLLHHSVEQIDFRQLARSLKGSPIERDRSQNEQ